MSPVELIATASLGAQVILWQRGDRWRGTSRVVRAVKTLNGLPELAKLALGAVHLAAVLAVLNEGPGLVQLTERSVTSPAGMPETARPPWHDAYSGDMLDSPNALGSDERWRPVD